MPAKTVIDEAALERTCVRLIQAVDRGSHSAPSADSDEHLLWQATVVAIGWMYMDLERAVTELESAVALQLVDGLIPRAPASEEAALPLLTSVTRMIYHGARGRQRQLEGRLAALVPCLDRFHAALVARGLRHLCLSAAGDDGVLARWSRAEAAHDVGVNALLVQADSDLADIAIHTGFATRQVIARRTRTAQALAQRLWWPEQELFAGRQGQQWLTPTTAESLLPLWAGAALQHQARPMLARHLQRDDGWWGEIPLATMAPAEADHDPHAPGRGAVSPLLNWLLIRGLFRYGREEHAGVLNDTLLDLVTRHGVWEAYSAADGHGLGQQDAPATAALVLDLIKTPYTYQRW